ncbi:MAG: type IX secretion system sortase PorU [Prevotella sp.]|nr:type IX secretion system sortase PorU [Prevotella sp.]
MRRLLLLLTVLLCATLKLTAQEFVNLTAPEVRIDSVLPVYTHQFPLTGAFADSTYTVSIVYPEFIDMSAADVERYHALTAAPLPALPMVEQTLGTSRGQGVLTVSLVPLVQRDGRYQKLVSFGLSLQSSAVAHARTRAEESADRYAAHSVLATGQWARISVPSTGVYQLTEALVRQAGFSSLSRVKVYGYGGALQPEVLTAEYLAETDDLQEVPTCTVGGRRLFRAVGSVSWASATSLLRTRNPYSDVGCYFITEGDGEPLTLDSATFVSSFYPAPDDYHSLYERDEYAWYHSGRNLYENTPVPSTSYSTYQLAAHDTSGTLTVVLSSDGIGAASVAVNDSVVGTVAFTSDLASSARATDKTVSFKLNGILRSDNTVSLRQTSGEASMRLDYLALTMPTPAGAPRLSSDAFPSPTLDFRITNQDHHADGQVDMVIIIPTTQKVLAQAERLKQLHEERDSLRVRIVPADELYNEFSSGTPDANAYRRYLKMLYDRAESEADMPRYLLLFGDGAWDNRMLSTNWRSYSPDDFLLCFESDDSFSETRSYVCDDFFCMLDDGEGGYLDTRDRADVGVGRLTARTADEAKIMVDKIVDYAANAHAGDWQNTLCFMGDDGNNNSHMIAAEEALQAALAIRPSYNVRRVYWDAYDRTTSATGFAFPDARRLVKQQMQTGALLFDYNGHGAAYQMSHEKVLRTDDFAEQTSLRLPLWVTASCDIMPFDTHEENIGETAMLNPRGGCVAFFGTTRTVFITDNKYMNTAFIKRVLGSVDGRPNSMGDAVRLAKNDVRALSRTTVSTQSSINLLHYSLLGDPALTLAAPVTDVVLDSINGQPLEGSGNVSLGAGNLVTVAGHVAEGDDFNGVVSLTVKDAEQTVVCRLHNPDATVSGAGSEKAYIFNDRPTTIYNGQDSVRNGRFNITFVLPQDISYSEGTGLMTAYALSSDKQREASGSTENFTMGSGTGVLNDGVGPSIYCYLNSSSFVNGGNVNTTPYFYAEITDKDGINAAGSSLGHDLELVVDGDLSMTYNLNEYFQYDFGDYRTGSVGYSLPSLDEGEHVLRFRAWDVLNNSSVAELKFNVVAALQPNCFSVECTKNPATTSTSFIINHDRTGSQMDVELEVFDASGRQLWHKVETGVATDNTFTIDWDLTTSSGNRLQTGVYLYRVRISSDGSKKSSQAQKLIILNK